MKQKIKNFLGFLKRRWWIIMICIALGVIVYSQTIGKAPDTTELTYKVKRQTLRESLSLTGQIDAAEKSTLRFQTSGRLTWLGVEEGDEVKKYQAIAALDQNALKKQLQKDLNDYEKERLDFDNDTLDYDNQGLPSNRYIRQDTIDAYKKAQYDLNSTVLDVELSDIALRYSTLISPIDGVVVSMGTKQTGINITPTQAEFVIVNPSTVYFSGEVDQTDVAKIKEGMSGVIVFDAFPDIDVPASVDSIALVPEEDESGAVYEVKIAFDTAPINSRGGVYRLGMTGDVEFVVKSFSDVVGVPTTFIKTEKDRQYVLIKKGNEKEKVYVVPGEEVDTATIIESGISAGDVVYD